MEPALRERGAAPRRPGRGRMEALKQLLQQSATKLVSSQHTVSDGKPSQFSLLSASVLLTIPSAPTSCTCCLLSMGKSLQVPNR